MKTALMGFVMVAVALAIAIPLSTRLATKQARAGAEANLGPDEGAQGQGGWQVKASQYGWQLDYAEARDLARQTGKPLMVVFRCVP